MPTNTKQMQIVHSIDHLKQLVDRNKRNGMRVGFVPTMGFLHDGHLSLVEAARKENELIVMSVFVNPAQFGPNEDLDAYPRNAENDARLAASAGVDILFMPSSQEMYPHEAGIQISPGALATVLCGASRPGHFDGVLKVVLKLFNLVDPDRSYFGMKDAQQLAIIEAFVRDFNLRTEIVRVPTCREADGLAKSSRNSNLSATQRAEAPILYQSLQLGAAAYKNGASKEEVELLVSTSITANSSGIIDYVNVLSYPSLKTNNPSDKERILACAVKFGQVRLIDNIIMKTKDGLNVQDDDE